MEIFSDNVPDRGVYLPCLGITAAVLGASGRYMKHKFKGHCDNAAFPRCFNWSQRRKMLQFTQNKLVVVRIFRFIQCLVFVAAAFWGMNLYAQTNSWTSPVNGNWEDLTWSLGVQPASGQDVAITNGATKTVQLTSTTASSFLSSLTVNSITLDAPPDTTNTLLLNNVGVSSPLAAGSITTGTNSVIALLSSAISNSGTFNLNGTLDQRGSVRGEP